MASISNNNIINSYTTAKDKSLRNSIYLTEYFFLKFQHLYTEFHLHPPKLVHNLYRK